MNIYIYFCGGVELSKSPFVSVVFLSFMFLSIHLCNVLDID